LFVAAVHAFGSRVEDDNHPPLWREIHAGNDRRRRGSSAAPAIDNESAVLEKAQANPGTRASPQQKRIARLIRRDAFEVPQGSGDAKRELGAGAQARMRGNGFVNRQAIGMGQAEVAREKSEMARRALRLQSVDRRRRRAADCQAGRWAVDRKPEAPETAAKSSIHIEKSEVKAARGRHGDAVEHDPSFPEHLPRFLPKPLAFLEHDRRKVADFPDNVMPQAKS